MLELGFPYKFVKWVMTCITTASYTFNVNGDLPSPFQAKKGLRQGDPISPYLFVICMEYLNRCLMQLTKNSEFRYCHTPNFDQLIVFIRILKSYSYFHNQFFFVLSLRIILFVLKRLNILFIP